MTLDPRAFGLVKAAYSVSAALDILSIGRTSLYAAVNRGDLHPVKFGRKTRQGGRFGRVFGKLCQGRRQCAPCQREIGIADDG